MRRLNKIIALGLSMIFILSGCGIEEKANNEIRDDYEENEKVVILPDSKTTYNGTIPEELANMTLTIENDYLAMYVGEDYQFAIYNKLDGSVKYSNAAYNLSQTDYNALPESTKKTLQSQVMIEYYTTDLAKMKMSSYPDARSSIKDQIWMEVNDDNSVTITYGLGTNFDKSAVFASLSEETYDEYDKRLNEMMDAGTLSRIVYRDFVNNYTKIVYEDLSDSDKESYTETYPNLPELGTIYIVKPLKVNNVISKIAEVYDLLGVTTDDKIAEAQKVGSIMGDIDFTYFEIPVTYSLEGMDLVVKCDLSDIYVSGSEYLTRVYLLPCFGATEKTEDGYIFVPDGSGSIIENDTTNNSMTTMSVSFYGHDYALDYSDYSELGLAANFPVWGLKSNDSAMFAVVENGAAVGGVTVQTEVSKFGYNLSYPYFEYEMIDDFGVEGVSYAFYEVPADTEYAVRYHMMLADEADYSGMARYYRSYLEENGAFDNAAKISDGITMDVELLGSIDKTVNYFGIPVDTEYAITSFDNAYEIIANLKDNGVDDMSVIYSAFANGGYNYKNPSKVEISNKLGGKKGANELSEKLEDINISLVPGFDFIQFYEKGNGITSSSDVVMYLKKSSAYISAINPASLSKSYEGATYLVNPALYIDSAESFVKNYDLETNNIYLASVGSILSANYDDNNGMTRVTALSYQKEMLDILNQNNFALKLDGANEYALNYASTLTNVSTSSSHQRLESYSIPFTGMVLKGNISYTCSSINQESNPDKALLEAIESGAGLHFLLMYANQLELQDTDQSNLFSVNYELWTDYIIEKYNQINNDLGFLSNTKIYSHEQVADSVNLVTYEDGTKIYVNYSDEAYKSKDGKVEALSYLVVR